MTCHIIVLYRLYYHNAQLHMLSFCLISFLFQSYSRLGLVSLVSLEAYGQMLSCQPTNNVKDGPHPF